MDIEEDDSRGKPVPGILVKTLGASVRKFKRRQRAAALCMGLAGAIALTVSFVPAVSASLADNGRGASPLEALRYGGALFVGASVLSFVIISWAAARRVKVLSALEETPGDVVWIFQEEVRIEGYRPDVVRTHVHLADGTRAWFQADGAGGEEILKRFAEGFPDISIGYSDLSKMRFKSDPASLKRKPDRTGELLTSRLRYHPWAHGM